MSDVYKAFLNANTSWIFSLHKMQHIRQELFLT